MRYEQGRLFSLKFIFWLLMRFIFTLFLLLFFSSASFAQSSKALTVFLKSFRKIDLPYCKKYTDEELDTDSLEISLSELSEDTVEIPQEMDTIVEIFCKKSAFAVTRTEVFYPTETLPPALPSGTTAIRARTPKGTMRRAS